MKRHNRSRSKLHRLKAAAFFFAHLSLGTLIFPGCISWNTADGTKHTIILGFGVVANKTTPDKAASAMRSHTLGLLWQPQGPSSRLVLGYHSLQQTSISPHWQGIVEVNASPGHPLTVEAYPVKPPAALQEHQVNLGGETDHNSWIPVIDENVIQPQAEENQEW